MRGAKLFSRRIPHLWTPRGWGGVFTEVGKCPVPQGLVWTTDPFNRGKASTVDDRELAKLSKSGKNMPAF